MEKNEDFFEVTDMICKPCKNCGSVEYYDCDTSEESLGEDAETGRMTLEPKTCDRCDLNQFILSDALYPN